MTLRVPPAAFLRVQPDCCHQPRPTVRPDTAIDARFESVSFLFHDLRGPLTAIRAMAEALEDGLVDDPASYYRQLVVEAGRLATLVDSLFLMSREHAGLLVHTREDTVLSSLVSDIVDSNRALAAQRAVSIEVVAAADVVVNVSRAQMSRAVGNLMSNAVRHTPSGSTVVVTATHEDDGAVLSVVDACGGIAEEELPRVFDLGWHGRTPPPDATCGGTGLGLAVARDIATAHGGRATVSNVVGGCRFSIHLPRAISRDRT